MTIITALRTGGRVWMASDSLCEDTEQAIRWDYPGKLAKINVRRRRTIEGSNGATTVDAEQLLIGTAGTAAIGAMVRHQMSWPDLPEDETEIDAWAQRVAVAFYDMCKERPFLIDPQSGGVQGSFLLAWRSHLWEISADLAIPVEDYASIGSGALVAQGVLYALTANMLLVDGPEDDVEHTPEHALRLAAEAAVKHAAGCGGEITVLST